jgi:hypothetical protein
MKGLYIITIEVFILNFSNVINIVFNSLNKFELIQQILTLTFME